MIDSMKRNLIKALAVGVVGGCAKAESKGRSVTTMTFNYTDRYIGDVVVDGAWTGGADAYGVGGGAQGLLAPSNPNRVATLELKWSVGSIYNIQLDSYTRIPPQEKTAKVELRRPYPKDSTYLVLHFYPDGHVEAELEADRPKRRVPPPAGYHR